MKLDSRQRAMLAEMGVRVWTPEAARAPAAPPAPAPANLASAAPTPHQAAAPSPAPAPAAAPALPQSPPLAAAWRLDAPRPLYVPAGEAAPDAGAHPVWLIALDSPTPDDPGAGEAGALLHAMLRAMGLQDQPGVYLSTVRRATAGAEELADFAQALRELQPAIVLALGQSPARCLLGGQEPLAALRAREHRLPGGIPVVVSFAPAYLVRSPKAKREAWADLQRAMALAGPRAPMP